MLLGGTWKVELSPSCVVWTTRALAGRKGANASDVHSRAALAVTARGRSEKIQDLIMACHQC